MCPGRFADTSIPGSSDAQAGVPGHAARDSPDVPLRAHDASNNETPTENVDEHPDDQNHRPDCGHDRLTSIPAPAARVFPALRRVSSRRRAFNRGGIDGDDWVSLSGRTRVGEYTQRHVAFGRPATRCRHSLSPSWSPPLTAVPTSPRTPAASTAGFSPSRT